MYYRVLKSIFGILFLIGSATCALAAERSDFMVNDDGGSSSQSDPRIAVGPDRGFVITWVDRRGPTTDIYLQRYGSDGFPVGRNVVVNDEAPASYQFEPAIAVDQSGFYSVIWRDYRNGSYPFGPDLYFQRYDASLSTVGANLQLTTELPDSTKESPDVAFAPWGEGVVVWADYRNRNWDIYGQIIDSDGSLVGSNFLVNDDTGTSAQHAPRVAIAPEGWFVVTWYDNRAGNDDVYVQRFDPSGNALGVNTKANENPSDARQGYSDVATDGQGHFTVVWTDWSNGVYPANPDIYSRKFDSTMNPVTNSIKINTDVTERAQRNPSIAADRMGNVAIIWSDSTGDSWDIAGQMIDVDGIVQEANFIANDSADSSQLHADVALDGQYRYICWVDDRNGNFDIYASVKQYNDISLECSPSALQFAMNQGGVIPAAQNVQITHIGYNAVDFDVASNVEWLDLSPASATSPQTISISVNTDTLPGGTYNATVWFVDAVTLDSSVTLSVRFDVYQPVIGLSADTVSITAFEGADEEKTASVEVLNTGTGSFTWIASEGVNWLSVSPASGSNGDMVSLVCNAVSLTEASYSAWVFFTSSEAAGSPDSLLVELDVTADYPYIQPVPDSFYFYTHDLTSVDTACVVYDIGLGTAAWTASAADVWLGLTGTTGIDGDQIGITIADLALDFGIYTTSIEIVDSNAFNISTIVPVVLHYYEHSSDTIRVDSGLVTSGQPINLPVTADLVNNIDTIFIPLGIDTAAVVVDSVVMGQTLPTNVDFTAVIDSVGGLIFIMVGVNQPDTFIAPGSYHVAELFLTAAAVDMWTTIDTVYNDSMSLAVRLHDSTSVVPDFIPSVLTIGNPTWTEDDFGSELPVSFELAQNRPNPFNPSTTIDYYLPRRSNVTLEIFNILGQRVRTLVATSQAAGRHSIVWSGHLQDGRPASSGVYFYRLRAGDVSLVRKMLLVK